LAMLPRPSSSCFVFSLGIIFSYNTRETSAGLALLLGFYIHHRRKASPMLINK
jgi:hypothetical protein